MKCKCPQSVSRVQPRVGCRPKSHFYVCLQACLQAFFLFSRKNCLNYCYIWIWNPKIWWNSWNLVLPPCIPQFVEKLESWWERLKRLRFLCPHYILLSFKAILVITQSFQDFTAYSTKRTLLHNLKCLSWFITDFYWISPSFWVNGCNYYLLLAIRKWMIDQVHSS